jgi:hypothetical protein
VHTCLREIDAVSRSDGQTVDDCGRCDEAILDRHVFSSFSKSRQQLRPFQPGVRIPGKTVETPGPCIEPAFQRRPLLSFGKDENSKTQFPEDHGINGDVRLIVCEATPRPADPAISSSARSKRWRQPDTSRGIGRFRFDRKKKVLVRTREQPVYGTLVSWSSAPNEAIVATIKTLDVELLPRLDPVHLPEFCWQNNLAFGRDASLHQYEISSYLCQCQMLMPPN